MNMDDCPFGVTTAGMPDVMPGREGYQNDLAAAIKGVLTPSRRQKAATIIFGSRGVGKTSLMHWAQEEAEKRNKALGGSSVDIYHFPNPRSLAAALADPTTFYSLPPSAFDRARERGRKWARSLKPALKPVSGKKSVGAQIALAQFVKVFVHSERTTALREERAAGAPVQQDHVRNMIERCRKKPLLILIDEAHNLPRDFKTDLAELAYEVVSDGAAGFHLVLAGTPGVNRWDGFDGITYTERYKRMPLDTLEPESTMEAITVPFKEHADITVPDDVLARIVNDSQGYPTFIQMWGQELWRVAEDRGVTLTMKHMRQAKAEVDKERSGFYGRRIDRINRHEDKRTYMAAHYAAASAMEKNSWSLGDEQLERAVAAVLPSRWRFFRKKVDAEGIVKQLDDDGFVWKPYTKFKPGIPSFMSHVMDHVRRDNPQMAADVDKRLSRTLALEGGGPAVAAQDVPEPVIAPPPAPAPGANTAHRPARGHARHANPQRRWPTETRRGKDDREGGR